MRRLLRYLGALLLGSVVGLLLFSGQARSAPATPVVVDPAAERMEVSAGIALLHDPERRFTLEDVAKRSAEFVPATERDLVTGFSPGVYWLRLTLANPGDATLTRWLSVGMNKTPLVALHLQRDGAWQMMRTGRNVARSEKPLVALDPVFPLVLEPGGHLELLLRMDSRGTNNMAAVLWQPHAYRHAEGRAQMLVVGVMGGLAIAALLAIAVAIRLRSIRYIWLALLMIAVAGVEASRENLIGTYLWPAGRELPVQVLAVIAAVSLFSLIKLAEYVLDVAIWWKRSIWLLLALRWQAVGAAVLSFANYGAGVRLLAILTLAIYATVLGLAAVAWQRKRPTAPGFLLAFGLAIVTEAARQLSNLGLLPWAQPMEFSTVFFLLASPLILIVMAEQTRQLGEDLRVARKLDRAKSAFFAQISHELRSPLNTILGFSRMLGRGSPALSVADGTSGIEKSTLRLLGLIDELLDEARTATGRLTVRPAPLAMQGWLDEIEKTTRVSIAEGGNRLICDVEVPPGLTLLADGQRLRQVLDNLLGNANRHTRGGTVRLVCRTTMKANDAEVHFAVEDDGEGIPADRLPHIFEPFERGSTDGTGYGLGLPICRDLVRQMGGSITVSSTPGEGSRFAFSLRLPVTTEAAEPTAGTVAVPGVSPSVEARSEKPAVLVVEDDPNQLALVSELLDESGFDVVTATDGKAGIASLGTRRWDLVLTDQAMPEASGWDVLRAVRRERPATPVILLSASAPVQPADFPADLTFDATLLKPTSADALLARLWYHVLRGHGGLGTLPAAHWRALGQLAEEGDVSGIGDLIVAARGSMPDASPTLDWIEHNLHRLNLGLLEHFAGLAAGKG